jgi:predicted RNase H-like nuclease
MQVSGVDWYRGGWVATVLDDARASVTFGADLDRLVQGFADARCIAVDMPIGLPTAGPREADAYARAFVGTRRNSVFPTPPREVLDAEPYAAANEVAERVLGKRISQQSYALRRNIRVVEAVAGCDPRLIEVHPEVSFRAMAGRELAYAKATWNGQMLRRRLLAAEGIELPDDLGRYALGEADSCPPGAIRGEREVIWY